jgi:hypothetical protein
MPLLHEDAVALLVRWLRQPDHGGYGYEIYLPALLRRYLETQGIPHFNQETQLHEMIPALYDAAWDLCRRGILRPGVRGWNSQATPDGASGKATRSLRLESSGYPKLIAIISSPRSQSVLRQC